MAEIYQNAWVTISATRAASCSQGFLSLQSVSKPSTDIARLPVACGDEPEGTTSVNELPLGNTLYPSEGPDPPIVYRGWAQQEFLLSPRVVKYLDSGIDLYCPAGTQSHDGLQELFHDVHGPLGRNPRVPLPLYSAVIDPTPAEDRKSWIEGHWYRIIEQYSSTETSLPDDKLPALAGVAAQFHRVAGSAYCANMWNDTLQKELLWISWHDSHAARTSKGHLALGCELQRKYRIPTWSWACKNARKSMQICREEFGKGSCRITSCEVHLAESRLPFGMVDGGCLTIDGFTKTISFEEARLNYGDERQSTHGRLHRDSDW